MEIAGLERAWGGDFVLEDLIWKGYCKEKVYFRILCLKSDLLNHLFEINPNPELDFQFMSLPNFKLKRTTISDIYAKRLAPKVLNRD